MIKQIMNSRTFYYLVFGGMYLLMLQILGFEWTMIMLGTTILGEIHYQYENPK